MDDMASVSCLAHRNTSASDNDDNIAPFWLDGLDVDGKHPYSTMAEMGDCKWDLCGIFISNTITNTQAISS